MTNETKARQLFSVQIARRASTVLGEGHSRRVTTGTFEYPRGLRFNLREHLNRVIEEYDAPFRVDAPEIEIATGTLESMVDRLAPNLVFTTKGKGSILLADQVTVIGFPDHHDENPEVAPSAISDEQIFDLARLMLDLAVLNAIDAMRSDVTPDETEDDLKGAERETFRERDEED